MKTIRISESILREMPMFQPTNQTDDIGLLVYKTKPVVKLALINDQEYVLGYISLVLNDDNIYVVGISVGDKNYGAFMYEAAASVIYPHYFKSSSYDTSNQAKNVWYNYLKRSDVERIKYKSEQETEELFMNYAYRLKTPKQYNKLIENGKNILEELNLTPDVFFDKGMEKFATKY